MHLNRFYILYLSLLKSAGWEGFEPTAVGLRDEVLMRCKINLLIKFTKNSNISKIKSDQSFRRWFMPESAPFFECAWAARFPAEEAAAQCFVDL